MSTKQRILIIDDDEDLLEVIKIYLEEETFEVYSFTHTIDVFSLIKKVNPDVIILDYIINGVNRYGINGGELCHQIKSNLVTKDIPVILLSGFDKVISSLGTYGADVFIPKPFDLDELASQVKQIMASQSS